jgi:hypothetical protein
MAHCALLALSASSVSVRVSSVHPSSVRRPVSSIRLSGVRASGVRCPVSARPVSRALCPTSGVRCPVRASGIRACRVRVRSVRTGGFVEREGAAGSHTPRDRPGRRLTPLQGSRCAGVRLLRQAACRSAGACCRRAAGHDLSPWVVGRPRWAALWPTVRACAAPPRPKAAGGPLNSSQAGRERGLTSDNRGGPAETRSGTILIRDNQALILTSQNVDSSLLSWAFSTR